MYILGISALYHDSAAVLICDGKIIAAAQEERFTRIKHDKRIPYHAIDYCLKEGQVEGREVDAVVYYDHPIISLDRFLHNLDAIEDAKDLIALSFDEIVGDKIWVHKTICRYLKIDDDKFFVTQHHASHAASAFFPSPFEEAVCITIDGVGEWATTTVGVGKGNTINLCEKIDYPDSLGLLYSAFTYFCGFKVNSGDYKFMGLAPYGEPIYKDIIKEKMIHIFPDGSYRLNMKYFDYQNGRAMTNEAFAELFGGKRREPESRITKREMDIAASAQAVLEEILLLIVSHAKKVYGQNIDNLVLAGGVALNCVANGVIQRAGIFKNIWIQPAAGDAGGALGAALLGYYHLFGGERRVSEMDDMCGAYLGPEYSDEEVNQFLKENDIIFHDMKSEESANEKIASLIAEGKVIGLCRGRMEYGPRALGNRSIIADSRSEEMQVKLNQKIKYRESFRPFAPSVLEERVHDYFELQEPSPYMLLVSHIRGEERVAFDIRHELKSNDGDMLPVVRGKRSSVPAITHVDYSARVQTVSKERNGQYYRLIKEFEKQTGCGVVINTSFNVRGEPIVCSPEDAYKCFMRTEMDVLVLNNYILYKEEQREIEDIDWRAQYELD